MTLRAVAAKINGLSYGRPKGRSDTPEPREKFSFYSAEVTSNEVIRFCALKQDAEVLCSFFGSFEYTIAQQPP